MSEADLTIAKDATRWKPIWQQDGFLPICAAFAVFYATLMGALDYTAKQLDDEAIARQRAAEAQVARADRRAAALRAAYGPILWSADTFPGPRPGTITRDGVSPDGKLRCIAVEAALSSGTGDQLPSVAISCAAVKARP